jgi:protein-L-isoaspartate(D-aspartate) O-methyltransferase
MGDNRTARAATRLIDGLRRAVDDERVLAALAAVPRERFVPERLRPYAYEDHALPIGQGQTISQPTIVAMMTAALGLSGGERVLDVGTGSGYQAAVLAQIAAEVVSVEVIDELREAAERVLSDLGIENVRVLPAGEVLGAPEHGPYDAILVAAAAPSVPEPLVEQLRPGGRLVIPIGRPDVQELLVVTLREDGGTTIDRLGPCRFVPLTGEHGFVE